MPGEDLSRVERYASMLGCYMIQQPETALIKTGLDNLDAPHDQLTLGETHPSGSLPAGGIHPNRVLSSLRGRYHWAVLLGGLLAVLGGAAGYFFWKPQYESVGLIRVAPVLPRVLHKTEESSPLPMYEGFIRTQMDQIQSQRVMDYAMQRPSWKELNRGLSDDAVQQFREQLAVNRATGSEVIRIAFVDEDPAAAVRGVKSVIDAYLEVFVEQDRMAQEDRLKTLENLENQHTSEIKSAQDKMQKLAEDFDSKSLELVYQSNLVEADRIDQALKGNDVQLAGLQAILQSRRQQQPGDHNGQANPNAVEPSARKGVAEATPSVLPIPAQRTPLQIAADQTAMQSLIQQKAALELELGQMRAYYSDNHHRVREGQKRLDNISQLLKPYEQRYLELTSSVGGRLAGGVDQAASAGEQLIMLDAQKKILTAQLAKVKEVLQGLKQKISRVDDLKMDEEKARDQLVLTKSRLEELSTESSVGGRITLISEPSPAGLPRNLGKRKQLVVLGFMAGLTSGVGLVVLIGLADRRCRYVSDAQESVGSLPLMGVLPRLPKNLADPEQAAIAAHSVQQIRMQLQLGSPSDRTQVVAITSAMPGDGKTSLALALGLSFAASRSRTLLIDFDLYGRGLTRQSDCLAPEKIGPLLLREGLVTTDQLADGLKRAARSKCRLGEALVQQGVVTKDDIDHALDLQARSTVGLHDVLEGKDLEACVYPMETPLLSLLPVGDTGPDLVASLSPASVGQLLDQARQLYNTIIVDTGPIPASTEASIVASQSDSVILTVSQGVQQRSAERAVSHLKALGAHIAGVVFNRAKLRDMEHSGFSSGVSSRASGGYRPGRSSTSGNGSLSSRFGPVAGAAALALPFVKHGEHAGDNAQTEHG
ncbi:MAG: hypothetical protein A2W31_04325 [Planctomycetes bacterium RBG_16_64_10]|nr:MAG: hypothetical protein A2W31_04325 [Planctomycetes bacterium RBG_16_64_10]